MSLNVVNLCDPPGLSGGAALKAQLEVQVGLRNLEVIQIDQIEWHSFSGGPPDANDFETSQTHTVCGHYLNFCLGQYAFHLSKPPKT